MYSTMWFTAMGSTVPLQPIWSKPLRKEWRVLRWVEFQLRGQLTLATATATATCVNDQHNASALTRRVTGLDSLSRSLTQHVDQFTIRLFSIDTRVCGWLASCNAIQKLRTVQITGHSSTQLVCILNRASSRSVNEIHFKTETTRPVFRVLGLLSFT